LWNKRIIAVVTIASVALGFLISIQIQAKKEVDIATEIQQKRVSQMSAVLENVQQEHVELQQEYDKLTSELDLAKNNEINNPFLLAKLDQLKMEDGTLKVKGPGIKIAIEDSGQDVNVVFPLTTDDLRRIINTLKFSKAEAISINGQRIVGSTAIVMSGSSTILVNQVPISRVGGSAYEILAIGDQDTLVDYLTKLEVLPMKQAGMKVEISREIVTIPSYKGGYEFTYSKKVDDVGLDS